MVVVTADTGIYRRDYHGAGVAFPPETRITRPFTALNHRIGRRPYGNTVTHLLPVSGTAGSALDAKLGISGNHCSQAGVFDPVPSEVAVPVVARQISVCRHDKRDVTVALASKSGTTALTIPGKERICWSDHRRTGFVLPDGKAIGAFDLVALDISVDRRH